MYLVGAESKHTLASLACQHLILELLIASVYDKLMGPSSDPNIQLFHRFSNSLSQLSKDVYEFGVEHEVIGCQIEPFKTGLVTSIHGQLYKCHLKNDYKELLHEFNLFVVQLYIKLWFTTPAATLAPRMDLELLQNLVA